ADRGTPRGRGSSGQRQQRGKEQPGQGSPADRGTPRGRGSNGQRRRERAGAADRVPQAAGSGRRRRDRRAAGCPATQPSRSTPLPWTSKETEAAWGCPANLEVASSTSESHSWRGSGRKVPRTTSIRAPIEGEPSERRAKGSPEPGRRNRRGDAPHSSPRRA